MPDPSSNRRDFLRKTGLAATATVTGLSLPQLSTPVSAGTSSHKWSETTESTYTGGTWDKRLVQTTTLEWVNAFWNDDAGPENEGGWEHRYRVSTLFAGRTSNSGTESNPALARQQLGITKQDYDVLWTATNNESYTGVYPTFNSEEPGYHSLGDLFETAISEMSFAAEFAFTAAAAIQEMTDAYEMGYDFDLHKDYDYDGSEYADAHYYEEFKIVNWDSDQGNNTDDHSYHYWDLTTMGSGALGYVDTRQEWSMRALRARHPEQLGVASSSVVETSTTEEGTKVYTTDRGWKIEKIPPGLIKARQKTADIPSEKAQKHIKENTPLYCANTGPVEKVEVNEKTGTGRNAPDAE